MRILLLGANGQVGWELQRALAPLAAVSAFTRAAADLANLEDLRALVRAAKADVIVNGAAYTAVDKAESERDLATLINATAVGVLAAEAEKSGALLVHYSTDYVYDGQKNGAYVETDATNPLSHYGATKLAGEDAIRAAGARHLIFRTSWVYAPRGHNFPRTMLRLAASRKELNVVADQTGAPTSAELIADVTAQVLGRRPADHLLGTYHLTAAGETTWCDYARRVLGLAAARGWPLQAGPDDIKPIATADYPTPAKRIANSRLATDKLRAAFGLTLPSWDASLDRFLAELPPEGSK